VWKGHRVGKYCAVKRALIGYAGLFLVAADAIPVTMLWCYEVGSDLGQVCLRGHSGSAE
jgi:hypothetical protein